MRRTRSRKNTDKVKEKNASPVKLLERQRWRNRSTKIAGRLAPNRRPIDRSTGALLHHCPPADAAPRVRIDETTRQVRRSATAPLTRSPATGSTQRRASSLQPRPARGLRWRSKLSIGLSTKLDVLTPAQAQPERRRDAVAALCAARLGGALLGGDADARRRRARDFDGRSHGRPRAAGRASDRRNREPGGGARPHRRRGERRRDALRKVRRPRRAGARAVPVQGSVRLVS